jgi:hypothetical protein
MSEISYWPGEAYDGQHLYAISKDGWKTPIPFDCACRHCGSITWRLELGATDRHWGGGYTCLSCATAMQKKWIGLVSPDGKEEFNARLMLGDTRAESLLVGDLVPVRSAGGKLRQYRVSHV